MRSGQIQQAIANGVPPFVLCRLVSTNIRTDHKRRGHIQDSIGSVFQSLPERVDSWSSYPRRATAPRTSPSACVVVSPRHGTA